MGGQHQPRGLPERLAADRARVLERHRVPLLRHDAAALHEAVGQPQVAEFDRRPEQQVLDDAAEADEHGRRRADALEQIVDGRDAAVGVAGRAVEAEQRGGAVAIDREPGAGDRAGAERVLVGARVGRFQPHGVALELLDHGLQIVSNGRDLRRLRVGVRREHRLPVAIGQRDERPAQVQRPFDHGEHQLPLRHAVHRHVDVVAGPRRVQPAGGILAAARDDQPLDVEEEILVGAVVLHLADLVERDAVERAPDGRRLGTGHDLLIGEHHEMRVLDRHQRHEKLRLGVLEVFVEDEPNVLGRELHGFFPRLRRFASRR